MTSNAQPTTVRWHMEIRRSLLHIGKAGPMMLPAPPHGATNASITRLSVERRRNRRREKFGVSAACSSA